MEAQTTRFRGVSIPRHSTLLDLLAVVNAHTDDDAEAVRWVVALVDSGTVTLTGNFRGARFGMDSTELSP